MTHAGAVDWAEFVTLAVAGAVANVGSVEKALQGRPGSWEADSERSDRIGHHVVPGTGRLGLVRDFGHR